MYQRATTEQCDRGAGSNCLGVTRKEQNVRAVLGRAQTAYGKWGTSRGKPKIETTRNLKQNAFSSPSKKSEDVKKAQVTQTQCREHKKSTDIWTFLFHQILSVATIVTRLRTKKRTAKRTAIATLHRRIQREKWNGCWGNRGLVYVLGVYLLVGSKKKKNGNHEPDNNIKQSRLFDLAVCRRTIGPNNDVALTNGPRAHYSKMICTFHIILRIQQKRITEREQTENFWKSGGNILQLRGEWQNTERGRG
jgi:hypothetical protein